MTAAILQHRAKITVAALLKKKKKNEQSPLLHEADFDIQIQFNTHFLCLTHHPTHYNIFLQALGLGLLSHINFVRYRRYQAIM